jgi:hypothetical protein
VIPCGPQWAKDMFQSCLGVLFTPFTCFEKTEKIFISVFFLFEAISKKERLYFQFGKVVRVGYLLERKKSSFFKIFTDFFKHK